jgi:hypothetical protein
LADISLLDVFYSVFYFRKRVLNVFFFDIKRPFVSNRTALVTRL